MANKHCITVFFIFIFLDLFLNTYKQYNIYIYYSKPEFVMEKSITMQGSIDNNT